MLWIAWIFDTFIKVNIICYQQSPTNLCILAIAVFVSDSGLQRLQVSRVRKTCPCSVTKSWSSFYQGAYSVTVLISLIHKHTHCMSRHCLYLLTFLHCDCSSKNQCKHTNILDSAVAVVNQLSFISETKVI